MRGAEWWLDHARGSVGDGARVWVCRGRGKGRGCHSRLGRGSRWRGGRWVISENAPGKGPVCLPGQGEQGIAVVRPHVRVDTNIRKGVAMRNLESALHPRAHSTSLQSVLLARPPSLPACRSFNLDWTRHWTECCAPAVIIHRCRIVTSNASYIPILVACTAHDIFALEVPPSPRLPLRPTHLDARDSRLHLR